LLRIKVKRRNIDTLSADESASLETSWATFDATTEVVAISGLPYGGYGFTRLILLLQLAKLAVAGQIATALEASVKSDLGLLARGEIEVFNDPLMTGLNRDGSVNRRTAAVLAALADLFPPQFDADLSISKYIRECALAVAEQLKIKLNTPDAGGEYPTKVTYSDSKLDLWSEFLKGQNLTPQSAEFESTTQSKLFEPALKEILHLMGSLGTLVRDESGSTSNARVSFVCLTGRGSLLRAFRTRTGNCLEQLDGDIFDFHWRRLFFAEDPKLAVARGAAVVVETEAEAADWLWKSQSMVDCLPYDIGTVQSDAFRTLVHRGSRLPLSVRPPAGAKQLTLYRLDCPGALRSRLGTISFQPQKGAHAEVRIDKNRVITNESGHPLISPEPRIHPLYPRLLQGEAQLAGNPHW
jgi:hypothetical protein